MGPATRPPRPCAGVRAGSELGAVPALGAGAGRDLVAARRSDYRMVVTVGAKTRWQGIPSRSECIYRKAAQGKCDFQQLLAPSSLILDVAHPDLNGLELQNAYQHRSIENADHLHHRLLQRADDSLGDEGMCCRPRKIGYAPLGKPQSDDRDLLICRRFSEQAWRIIVAGFAPTLAPTPVGRTCS